MKQLLIGEDFFPAEIEIDKKEIFPMIVVATMSSGKSTLINALLGEQLLPVSNNACTAKKYSILDDDQQSVFEAYITSIDNSINMIRGDLATKLKEINGDEDVSEILIRGNVNGIINSDRSLLIVDTPGPNNSRDEHHWKVMEDVLGKVFGGVVLYVINATQFGISDDKQLLLYLSNYCKNKPYISPLFVINKIDRFDEEKGEKPEQLVLEVKEYLKESGFPDPEVIPISALAALVFKKVLKRTPLTRSETHFFKEVYELFKPEKMDLRMYSLTKVNQDNMENITVGDNEYMIGAIKGAVDRTGISLVEQYIQNAQLRSGYQSSNYILVKRN